MGAVNVRIVITTPLGSSDRPFRDAADILGLIGRGLYERELSTPGDVLVTNVGGRAETVAEAGNDVEPALP